MTPFGGMSLMKRVIDSIGIREYLSTLDSPEKGSNRSYNTEHIIESFWLSIWTGGARYIYADWLRYVKTIQTIFGWDKMPSQSTYSRFFGKFSQCRNTAVFPSLQKNRTNPETHWKRMQRDGRNPAQPLRFVYLQRNFNAFNKQSFCFKNRRKIRQPYPQQDARNV